MRTKGLLEMVQGMGVTLENTKFLKFQWLSDYNITGLHHAFATCQSLPVSIIQVLGSEIVGLYLLQQCLRQESGF